MIPPPPPCWLSNELLLLLLCREVEKKKEQRSNESLEGVSGGTAHKSVTTSERVEVRENVSWVSRAGKVDTEEEEI